MASRHYWPTHITELAMRLHAEGWNYKRIGARIGKDEKAVGAKIRAEKKAKAKREQLAAQLRAKAEEAKVPVGIRIHQRTRR